MYCLLSLYPDFFYVVCRVGRVVPAGRVIVCCRGARVRTHECWEYLMFKYYNNYGLNGKKTDVCNVDIAKLCTFAA